MISQAWMVVQVLCQYRQWFWSYSSSYSLGFDQKFVYEKDTHLNFVQYPGSGVYYGYQIWY